MASEFVGSSLAKWFGLDVPDFAILDLPAEACYDLPRGARVQPGPAFVSRRKEGRVWGGSIEELRALVNPQDITWLVIFDTWVRNRDRHPPNVPDRKPNKNNVYLADTDRADQFRLCAIDHTHCFDIGDGLNQKLRNIDLVKDDRTFGLFPEFVEFIQVSEIEHCRVKLLTLRRDEVEEIISHIPTEWQVPSAVRTAWCDQILRRASYIADRIENGWRPESPNSTEPPS